jgi:hypothetical protein
MAARPGFDTGALCLTLGGPGQRCFESARFAGGAFDAQELTGPQLPSTARTIRVCRPEGLAKRGSGPVSTIVQTSGKHTGAGGEKLDFDLLIYAMPASLMCRLNTVSCTGKRRRRCR